MSSQRTIVHKDYSDGKAIIDVKVAVINPDNLRQTVFEKKAKLDTGFDAGFHIMESEKAQLDLIGVRPTIGKVSLAGNVNASAQFCFGYLQKIGDYELPPPGIEITLIFQGTRPTGLLGLEAMSGWIVTFDGPAQSFKITC